MSGDFVQLLQFILMALSILFLSYCVVKIVRKARPVSVTVRRNATLRQELAYIRELSAEDYLIYEKYDIWRVYRYSRI